MNTNLKIILDSLTEEHLKTAEPIGSNILVKKYSLRISSATARQRLGELENLGYIFQPHTSAGRVPTEKAYKLHVYDILKKISKFTLNKSKINTNEESLKTIAKKLAQESNLAIFWAFDKKNLYYTGVTNLLKQPEFSQINRVYDISQIIDDIDDIIDQSFNTIPAGEHILIGSSNPFGSFCSSVIIKYKSNSGDSMFGFIGPMRMDYETIIKLARATINNL